MQPTSALQIALKNLTKNFTSTSTKNFILKLV